MPSVQTPIKKKKKTKTTFEALVITRTVRPNHQMLLFGPYYIHVREERKPISAFSPTVKPKAPYHKELRNLALSAST